MTRPRSMLLVGIVFALVAASCGSSEETTTSAGDTVAPETTQATTSTVAETTTTSPADATTTTTTEPDATTSSTLAGEPIDFFPSAGDELAVVGVAHDDVLNVRVGPGILNDIVDMLDPTGSTSATDNARDLGLAIWVEHDTGDAVGWSNYAFLAFAGGTFDATSQVVDQLGEIPTAESMEELGLIVAESQASTDVQSSIVMSVAPTVGDLGEVTYDVIGLADDSVKGVRLHVFGEPVTIGEPPIDGFSLVSVELTLLCGRGVTEDGELCV